MSTGSSIAVKQGEKIKTVYCHFDGYPSGVGEKLLNNYNSQEKADSIVNLGDLSSLGETVECPPGHAYGNMAKGCSVFYGRDRGETGVEAIEVGSYVEALKANSQEYNYFWDGEKWMVDGEILTKEMIAED